MTTTILRQNPSTKKPSAQRTLKADQTTTKDDNMTIKPNSRGGWSILIRGRLIGNYATKADAERVVKLNIR